jgi:hypothetical protein
MSTFERNRDPTHPFWKRAHSPAPASIRDMPLDEFEHKFKKTLGMDIPTTPLSTFGKVKSMITKTKPQLDMHKAQLMLGHELRRQERDYTDSKIDPEFAEHEKLQAEIARRVSKKLLGATPHVPEKVEWRKPITPEEIAYENRLLRQLENENANPGRRTDYDTHAEQRDRLKRKIEEMIFQYENPAMVNRRPLVTPTLRLHKNKGWAGGKSRRSKRSKRVNRVKSRRSKRVNRSLTKRRKH